jgi:hypothetical protein
MVRTHDDVVYTSAGLVNQAPHFLVHLFQRRQIEQPSPESGLIARNGNGEPGVSQDANALQAACYRRPLRRRFDERIRLDIDHAVAIKNNQSYRHAENLGYGKLRNVSDLDKAVAQTGEKR